jgi:hypothetical protein
MPKPNDVHKIFLIVTHFPGTKKNATAISA